MSGPNAASQYAYNYFINAGLPPHAAAAWVGHLAEESGWFLPDVINGKRRGDSGSAGFIAQWRGPRLRNLINFAKQRGTPLDLDTQLAFVIHEGKAGLDDGAALAYQQSMASKSLPEAVAAFAHFERSAGYSRKNPYGIDTFNKRAQHAQQVMAAGGGGTGTNPVAFDPAGNYGAGGAGNVSGMGGGFNINMPSNPIEGGFKSAYQPYNSSSNNSTAAFQSDPYLEGDY